MKAETVVVFGASGPTGLLCVKRLAAVTTLHIKAIVRSRARAEAAIKAAAGPDAVSRVEIVEADLTQPDTLPAAVQGADYVLCTAGGRTFWSAEPVDNKGVGNLVDAVKAAGSCKRFLLVSGVCTHPSNRYHPVRIILNTFVKWRTLEHKYAGEERLAASGLAYTIIKPPFLTDEPPGHFLLHMDVDATRECVLWKGPYNIGHADVAAVCVEALLRPTAANKRLSVYKHRYRMAAQALPEGPGALEAELERVFRSAGM